MDNQIKAIVEEKYGGKGTGGNMEEGRVEIEKIEGGCVSEELCKSRNAGG